MVTVLSLDPFRCSAALVVEDAFAVEQVWPDVDGDDLPESGNASVGSAASVVVGRFSALDESRQFERVEKFAFDRFSGDLLKTSPSIL